MRGRILYIQYTNPAAYPPLEHSSRSLAQAGWRVLFLGTVARGVDALRFPPHPRIRVRYLAFCAAGLRQKLHYLGFCAWVLGWALYWRPAWVYASDPLACPIALALNFLPGVRVIYHEHDSPTPTRRLDFMSFVLWLRRRLARRAALCLLPNAQRRRRFTQEMGHGVEALCVWNCPTRDEVDPPRSDDHGESLWVLYHGSIVPPRLPSTVLHALARLPQAVKLRIVGYETVGHKGYVRQLQELAGRLGLTDRIQFLGAVPTRESLLDWCRRSDVGLALMPRSSSDFNEQTMSGASNKAFDYLACGLVLVVSDLPDWREMYVEPGYGLSCNPADPQSIATALHWLWEHPARRREMGEQGRRRILAEWNYERQFAPVRERLDGRARCV